jgi:putative transposase
MTLRVWRLLHESRLPRKNGFNSSWVKNNFVGAPWTITNRQKIQALYWLKAGSSQSLTDVAERLGVDRITVHRWLKQYSVGGLPELLKMGQSTGRPQVIPRDVIAGVSNKLSQESCDLKVINKLRHGLKTTIRYQSNIKHYTNNYTIQWKLN